MIDPMLDADTVTEALDLLRARGYADSFEVSTDGLHSSTDGGRTYQPDHTVVDHTFRFEGDTDPADEAIVLGVTCADGHRGVVVAAYGTYVDEAHTRVLQALTERR